MSGLPPPRLPGGPHIMGVVNVTPDSFSDGGLTFNAGDASQHALKLLDDGADILDIGGESTRPGAAPVSAEEEIDRVAPVIERVRAHTAAPISIDTMKPEVARAAFKAGATIWNDVRALSASGALETAVELRAPVILMHMQGDPRTMQLEPHYEDVVRDVGDFLTARVAACRAAGLSEIWIDPGIGFGKTLAHNLALTRALKDLSARAGAPLLYGASRKSFIQKIDENAKEPLERLGGSIAAALYAAHAGASILRVHDVRETAQALRVATAIGEQA